MAYCEGSLDFIWLILAGWFFRSKIASLSSRDLHISVLQTSTLPDKKKQISERSSAPKDPEAAASPLVVSIRSCSAFKFD